MAKAASQFVDICDGVRQSALSIANLTRNMPSTLVHLKRTSSSILQQLTTDIGILSPHLSRAGGHMYDFASRQATLAIDSLNSTLSAYAKQGYPVIERQAVNVWRTV